MRRSRDMSVSARTKTRFFSRTSSASRETIMLASPERGPHPEALKPGIASCTSASLAASKWNVGSCSAPLSTASGSACRRGKLISFPGSLSLPHVLARAFARSASSAKMSRPRSRIRRGSTSTKRTSLLVLMALNSESKVSPRENHGSQLSIPSKTCASLKRSQCSRPHGSLEMS